MHPEGVHCRVDGAYPLSLIANITSAERSRRHREKVNADPTKRAKRLAYQRAYNKKYYETKKHDPAFKAPRERWLKDRPGYSAAMYRKHYVKRLIGGAKKRAKERGWEFDLVVEDVNIPSHCPVLGIPLKIAENDSMSPNSPTLDRVHNHYGYIRGNVIVVSRRANILKRDATLDEMRKLVAFYEGLEF